MSYLHMLSPPQGLLHSQCEQQDFWKGAEVLKSQHPVSRTPPSSSVFSANFNDDWTVQESHLGYNLEAFYDVLPQNFGPEDLFEDCEELDGITEITQQVDYNQVNHINQPDTPLFSFKQIVQQKDKKPKLTLKLKKVKCPKTPKSAANKQKAQTFEIVQPATCLPSENVVFIHDEIFSQTQDFSAINAECSSPPFNRYVPSASPIAPSLSPIAPSLSPIAPSPELTLKDVLGLEDADTIIESSLSPYIKQSDLSSACASEDEINFMSPSSEVGANQNIAFWDNEDQALKFSPASTSENYFYPSSNTSPNYVQDEAIYNTVNFSDISSSPTPSQEKIYNTVNFSDASLSPTPSQTKSPKRAKKPRLSQESRKIRKKEQNKQAAIRYRMKKKQEDQALMDAVKHEEEEREKLEKKYNSLRQEISFMKKLMRETLIARKLVPGNAFD